MMKNFSNTSFKKGATAKSIIITVSIITIISLIVGSTYYVWQSFFYYPDFLDSLKETFKAKSTSLTEFNFDNFSDEGTSEINFAIPDQNLDAQLKIERMNRSTLATLNTNDQTNNRETLNVIQKYYVLGTYDEDFNNGEIYGSTILGLREKINKSIFAPGSGSDYELKQEFVDKICVWADFLVGQEEHSAKKQIVEKIITDAVKESDIAETYFKSNETVSISGESRKCKVESFIIDKNNVASFIEKLSEAIDELEDEQLEAVEYYAEMGKTFNIVSEEEKKGDTLRIALRDILDRYSLHLENREDLNFKFDVKICYRGKYLSAIIIDYDYASHNKEKIEIPFIDFAIPELNQNGETDAAGKITLDFGENPSKTRNIYYKNDGSGVVNGVKFTGSEFTYSSKKNGDTIEYSTKGHSNGEEKSVVFSMNAAKGDACFEVISNDIQLLKISFKFSDSAEKLVLEISSVDIKNTTITDFPYSLKMSFYKSANVIRLGEYNRLFVDIADFSKKEDISKEKAIKKQEENFDDVKDDFDETYEKWKNIFAKWNTALKESDRKIASNYVLE